MGFSGPQPGRRVVQPHITSAPTQEPPVPPQWQETTWALPPTAWEGPWVLSATLMALRWPCPRHQHQSWRMAWWTMDTRLSNNSMFSSGLNKLNSSNSNRRAFLFQWTSSILTGNIVTINTSLKTNHTIYLMFNLQLNWKILHFH